MKFEKHSDISSVISVVEGTAPGTFRGRSSRYRPGKYFYDHCEHLNFRAPKSILQSNAEYIEKQSSLLLLHMVLYPIFVSQYQITTYSRTNLVR